MLTNPYFIFIVLWIAGAWITINYNINNWMPYAETLLMQMKANPWLVLFVSAVLHFLFWPIILTWAFLKRVRRRKQIKDMTLDIDVESNIYDLEAYYNEKGTIGKG